MLYRTQLRNAAPNEFEGVEDERSRVLQLQWVRLGREGLIGAATTSNKAVPVLSYPGGLNSGATTICPREVTLNRMSLTGW